MNQTHAEEKKRVALISLSASLGLALVKLAAALVSGSLALLSEAIHSLFDFGATAMTLLAIRIADQPADDEHHYGHAKVESVVALIETAMLFGVTGWVAYEAITRLLGEAHVIEVSWWLFAILAASVLIDWNRSRALAATAEKTSSEALAADALHFRSDMYSSIAVAIGLGLTVLGFEFGDALAALVVSGFIAMAAWQLARRTLATLLDAAPAGVAAQVGDIATALDGVLRVSRIRVRPAGPTLFVDVSIDVPRTMPVPEVDQLSERLSMEIIKVYPASDVTVTTLAVELDNETAFDKISLIAAAHRTAIHHLTVQDIDGRLAVSFDLEIDGNSSLEAAHDKATQLEAAVREGLGGDVEVETHIEPLPLRMVSGKPVNATLDKQINTALQKFAASEKSLKDIHNVRIRATEHGIFVHYHCRFKPATSVDRVHDVVDRIENKLRASKPGIARVVAHAEPIGTPQHKL